MIEGSTSGSAANRKRLARPVYKLPASLRSTLLQLPPKAQRLLLVHRLSDHIGVPTKEVELAAGVASDLTDVVDYFAAQTKTGLTAATADVLSLEDGAVAVSLLKLVALAVRLPVWPAIQGAIQTWHHALNYAGGLANSLLGDILGRGEASAPVTELARKLLHMDTLQACARQFAALLAEPPTTTEGWEAALGTVQQVAVLPQILVAYGKRACKDKATKDSERPKAQYLRELKAALRDSQVLEHMARLAMPAVPAKAGRGEGLDIAVRSSCAVTLLAVYNMLGCSILPSQKLSGLASGPCADFAVTTLGVAVLCSADGGPAYGLPKEVLEDCYEALMFDEDNSGYLCSEKAASVCTATLKVFQSTVLLSVREERLGRRAAATMLLRFCSVSATCVRAASHRQGPQMVAAGAPHVLGDSASAAAAAGVGQDGRTEACGSGGRQSSGEGTSSSAGGGWGLYRYCPLDVSLRSTTTSLVAVWALLLGHPAKWRAMAVEWWEAALTLCAAVGGMSGKQVNEHLEELKDIGQVFGGALLLVNSDPAARPPAPAPPDVAAPLAAGIFPRLEHLLRRADQDRQGPEAVIIGRLKEVMDTTRAGWELLLAPLVAYGDPVQAAGLRSVMYVLGGDDGGEVSGGEDGETIEVVNMSVTPCGVVVIKYGLAPIVRELTDLA